MTSRVQRQINRSINACETLESRLLFTIPGTSLDIWHTYAQATLDLQTIANTYPTLTKLVSLGTTASTNPVRQIWALEITDNPGVQEDEPEFYYQGSMHGDEPVGMENSFHLIQTLLEGYATTPRYQSIVNNMDLWFVPNMNWDGYSRTGGARRENLNGVDLNRNFPEWTTTSGGFGNMLDGPAPSTAGRQPETIAMMNFRRSHHFVAAANFHGGDLVVNYPWDTNNNGIANYAATPEDAMFREFSLTYSRQNSPMFTQSASLFPQGITNGDDWYEVNGGMQDWAYIYTGSNDVTIELGYTKYPSATTLPTQWTNNRESMLQFIEAANWGVRGFITDATTGAPLAAKITVLGLTQTPAPDAAHPSTHTTFSDPALGDYHRMLLPGTYQLKFEAAGYTPQTLSVTIGAKTTDATLTQRMNVALAAIDTTPPTVQATYFDYSASAPALTLKFSENVLASLTAGDLNLQTPSTTIPSGDITLSNYDAGTNTATFTFPNYAGGKLPSGAYSVTLKPNSVTDASNNSVAIFSYSFLYINGLNGAAPAANDSTYVRLSPINQIIQVWQNVPTTGSATYSMPLTVASQLVIDGNGGNDTLTLDFTNGDMRPTGAGRSFGYRLGAQSETLKLTGPTSWTFATDPALDANQPNLALELSNGASATFTAPLTHLDGLTVAAGGSAFVATNGNRTLVTKVLSLTGDGKLDLNDNDFIATNTPKGTVEDYVRAAYDFGNWDGIGGIFSSAAKNNPGATTTLGVMSGDEYLTNANADHFNGIPVVGSDVLIKYTYYGDVDFNGQIDGSDYNTIDFGFLTGASGWANGDVDYNGQVDGSDYNSIDFAFLTQNGIL